MSVMTAGGLAEGRRGGALWFLLVALGCGLLAAWIAVRAVSAARREVPAVMVRHEVPPLGRIGPGDLVLAQVPAAAVPAGALRTLSAAQGRFTRMGLVPGEIVTSRALDGGVAAASAFDVRLGALAQAGHCAPAAAGPPPATGPACPRLVAMALPLTADQGFQMVNRGDTVDVVAGYSVRQGNVAQIVVADIPVIDKIANTQGSAPAIPGTVAAGLGAASGWLVVGVSPADALRLQLVQTSGKLAVLLEAPGAPAEPPGLDSRLLDTANLAGGSDASPTPPAVAGVLPGMGRG